YDGSSLQSLEPLLRQRFDQEFQQDGGNSGNAQARAINDNGWIVGDFSYFGASGPVSRLFLYDGTDLVELGLGQAVDLNNSGQVLVRLCPATICALSSSSIHDGSGIHSLGNLDGHAINNLGHVAGTIPDPDTGLPQRAAFHDGTALYDLNDLVDAADP